MNKKIPLLFLTAALASSFVFSCAPSETVENVTLPYGSLYDASLSSESHFQKIAYSDFSSMVKETKEDKKAYLSFFLVVRGSSVDCRCWSKVRENLIQYQKAKNLLVYYMSIDDFKNGDNERDFKGLNLKSGEQTIAIYEEGSLKYQTNIDESSDFSKNYSALASYLNEHLNVGNVLYINKNQLDSLYETGTGGAPFLVGFSRSGCPDCAYLNLHHLKELASESKYATSYLIDCDQEGIRKYKGEEANESGNENEKIAYRNWVEFKNEYGLSSVNNEEFGYKEGYVPTWTFSLPGLGKASSIRDMFVWGNDRIEKTEEGYFVADSYFDGSRKHPFLENEEILKNANVKITNLKNLKVEESELEFSGSTPYWTHEGSAKYEDPLLSAFFDTYLSKK